MATRSLTVMFETTPEAVRALLPPPLEPTPEAIGSAWVGEIGNSNCAGPFLGAAVYIRASYRDVVGNYCVTMPISTDTAVIFGRELYGEPKKLAKIIFEHQGEHVWGSAERYDIRYMSLRGRIEGAGPLGRHQFSTFHFKYLTTPHNQPATPTKQKKQKNNSKKKRGKGGGGGRPSGESPAPPLPPLPLRQ